MNYFFGNALLNPINEQADGVVLARLPCQNEFVQAGACAKT